MKKNFQLDPFHFISVPSFAESSLLLHISKNHEREKIPPSIGLCNNEQTHLYEAMQNNIRGGFCASLKKYTEAGRDKNGRHHCIKYFDANGLYQNSMRNY